MMETLEENCHHWGRKVIEYLFKDDETTFEGVIDYLRHGGLADKPPVFQEIPRFNGDGVYNHLVAGHPGFAEIDEVLVNAVELDLYKTLNADPEIDDECEPIEGAVLVYHLPSDSIFQISGDFSNNRDAMLSEFEALAPSRIMNIAAAYLLDHPWFQNNDGWPDEPPIKNVPIGSIE